MARYSVIPLYFPFKNDFLDIGPLITPEHFFFLIISRAFLNDFSMYEFEIVVIFFFENENLLYLTFTKFISPFFIFEKSLLSSFNFIFFLNFFTFFFNISFDDIKIIGCFNFFFIALRKISINIL